ncbi:Oidioi.mRNA.OKI2018_I69.XSR.g15250.t2.cds [Oikopleura dioica]|uniref:Oidioi.mRNA.OKI2018_I69.XSR.g15250.t2.cds n=1 Tax=Oikopleura dioica TaxID=34765 RepID=A0ABN7SLD0_OIKDI|nr:Oidioi.mRNA.OKI2018_I69.XSR.g15250.t2.cds [Oikopleura dioica]
MGKDRQTSARREWMRQKARERENQDGEGRNEQSSLVSGDKSINFCTKHDAPKSKKTAKKKRNTSKYVNKNKKSFKSFGNGPDTRNSHLLQESSNSERNESTFVPETSVWSDNYNRSFGNSHSNDTDCTFVPQTLDTTWASVYSQQSENTFVPQTLDDTWKTNNESVAYVPQLINENHNT